MIIAIDGPAGAGKSTVAKFLARRLGFLYLDTGAMYRALTLKAIEKGIPASDPAALIEMAEATTIDLVPCKDGSLQVILDGQDVSAGIREPRVSALVSEVAKIGRIRQRMVRQQRRMGRAQDTVMDGRDIGTVVFPDAEKKFFLDAQFSERVRRRHKEFCDTGKTVTPRAVERDLHNRDAIDSTREVAPLKKAHDAVYIDTTPLTIEEVVSRIMEELEKNG